MAHVTSNTSDILFVDADNIVLDSINDESKTINVMIIFNSKEHRHDLRLCHGEFVINDNRVMCTSCLEVFNDIHFSVERNTLFGRLK